MISSRCYPAITVISTFFRVLDRCVSTLRPRGVRAALAVAVLVLVTGAAGAATIEGQVFDTSGEPLGDVDILVVQQRGGSIIPGLDRPTDEKTWARGKTDDKGFFRIDVQLPPRRGRVLVRIAPDGWDDVRYVRPQDVNVTKPLRRHQWAAANFLVAETEDWPRVVREIRRVGGLDTDRGRVLRRHGLPAEREEAGEGSVVWAYPGVSFVFRDGELVKTRREQQEARRADEPRGSS